MTKITNHMPTDELQALDAAHHLHPFTHNDDLAQKGSRIITAANGITLTDSDGKQYLDAMAGLWCVNIGYGRDELAEVAAAKCANCPTITRFSKQPTCPRLPWGRGRILRQFYSRIWRGWSLGVSLVGDGLVRGHSFLLFY